VIKSWLAKRKVKKVRRKVNKQTNIEAILEGLLVELRVTYIREHYVGNYRVDFYLPDYKLSLQADGGYYHGRCLVCRDSAKGTIKNITGQKYRDKSCITYHKYKKINIIRICECQLLHNIGKVKDTILKGIETILTGKNIYISKDLIL
jgi:very-short-patch-repair endonuclease